MDPGVSEWLSLVIRWVHIITGIAWVGASFYFNWLLNHLRHPQDGDKAVVGELWAIHAGGFFKVQKRNLPAHQLPEPLHWFKWEAYWTWISGFLLLAIVYYLGAGVYLVDRSVADISAGAAVAIGIGTLVVSWFVYDLLWRSPLARNSAVASAVSFVLVVAVAWGLSQVFSGRGAYIHVGAMLGTLMAGNVFRVIMPAQRHLVAAVQQGSEPDPAMAADAGLRSLHNNYLTLPVLFLMISNHYPSTYGYELNWLVLAVLFVVGAGVRHYFNIRHRTGNWSAAWLLGVAAVTIVVIGYFTTSSAPVGAAASGDGERVSFTQAQTIINDRCVSCHSANPANEAFRLAIKGVYFDTPEQIRLYAQAIKAQAVTANAMPLGNLTQMTQEERHLLGRWLEEGASID